MAKGGRAHEERFTELVQRQSRFVFRVAFSILRNTEDAEDVVQEVFLKLYRTDSWLAIREERAFLARVAWRLAVERIRPRTEEPAEDDLPSAAATPETAVIEADTRLRVRRLIDSLPEELRQPLALSTVDEMSSREIAAVMDIPEGTVRTRLARARDILRQKLAATAEGNHARR